MDPAPLSWPRLVAPAVSIVICNYNYSRYLQAAIDSALVQRPFCQVIVVDDGSTDGSRELLSHLDPSRVEVVLQNNGGQLAAYNAGFSRCTGEVVIFLDADDVLLPHAARAMAVLFDTDTVKVHCRMDTVNDEGEALGTSFPSTLAQGDVGNAFRRHGLLYPSAPGSGNAYRRAALQRVFPVPPDPTDRVGADFYAIYGVAVLGRIVACDTPLVLYRIHRRAGALSLDAETRAGLAFGNAAQGNDEAVQVGRRYTRLAAHLAKSGVAQLPEHFMDFSVQKSPFAAAALSRPYWTAWRESGPQLRALLRSLWLQPANSIQRKLGLSLWAFLILAAPRYWAAPLARYVCNPASRVSR